MRHVAESCNFSNIIEIRVVSSANLKLMVRFLSVNSNSSDMLGIYCMLNSNNFLSGVG